jgi:hypothetical protein
MDYVFLIALMNCLFQEIMTVYVQADLLMILRI